MLVCWANQVRKKLFFLQNFVAKFMSDKVCRAFLEQTLVQYFDLKFA